MLVARPGGIVRAPGLGAGAIQPLVHPQDGMSILQAVEMIDGVRENRTGVTKYNQGLDANSLNKTATGITQIMTAAQQRIELIARIFAETGVKCLMLIVHAMAIKHGRKEEVIKLRNQWVAVNPRNWKSRKDVSVSVGLGTGNKDQMLQHLQMILLAQQQAIQIGVATPQNVYNALVKLTQNAGFKNAEEFWTDPSKSPPQQQGPSPEQVKAQAEMEKEQFKQQSEAQKKQFEAQTAAMEADKQRAFEASEKEKDRQLQLALKQLDDATKIVMDREGREHQSHLETAKHAMSLEKQTKDNSEVISKIDGSGQEISQVLSGLTQILHALRQDMASTNR
jgi:hypothetical protein